MEKRPSSGIWGGLFGFFEFANESELENWLLSNGLAGEKTYLDEFKHVFSHFNLMITPVVIDVTKLPLNVAEKEVLAYNLTQPQEVGLATPTKKIIKTLTRKG